MPNVGSGISALAKEPVICVTSIKRRRYSKASTERGPHLANPSGSWLPALPVNGTTWVHRSA
jgi:hypothetical protein